MKTLPAIIAQMQALLAEVKTADIPASGDTAWHLDCLDESLTALWEIHVEEPRRAEEAEQARHEDVMENGSYAERRHEVLGDES